MVLLRRLILISFMYFSVLRAAYEKIDFLRTSHGDEFTWDGSCSYLDAIDTYSNGRYRCRCRLDGLDGTFYNGSFYRSSGGNYKCYYDMGQVADASFTLGTGSCSVRSSQIATFGKGDKHVVYLGDDIFTASSLEIRSVQYFSYQSTPLKEIVNPFRLHNKSVDSTQEQQNITPKLYSFQLRWKSYGVFDLYAGHMLRVVFESKDGLLTERNHSLLLKIPGKREYFFQLYETATTAPWTLPESTSTTITTSEVRRTRRSTTIDVLKECANDSICSKYLNLYYLYYDKWVDVTEKYYTAKNESSTLAASNGRKNKIIIGLGVVCGVLLLIIIILIILLCCRNGCCKRAEKPSLVISSPSPMVIAPRRDTGDKPPVAPARTRPGAPLNKKGGTKKIPEQPLYESIHRRNDLYETPIDGESSPYHFETLNREIYQETGYIDPL